MPGSINNLQFGLDDLIRQSHPLALGSDCTGMDMAHLTLTSLGIAVDNKFASEISPSCRRFLRCFSRPGSLHSDIATRVAALCEDVDLYTAGFPCVDYSALGVQRGTAGKSGRILYHILLYCSKHFGHLGLI